MKKKSGINRITILFVCCMLSKNLLAQFDVIPRQIIPPVHSIDAEVYDVIQIPFNAAVNLNNIQNKISITGKLTGEYSGDFNLDPTHTIVEFHASRPFHPGEEIIVFLSDEFESATGTPISAPFQWSFTVGAPEGAGDFEKYPPYSLDGEMDPFVVCPADLDQDGYVDLITANNATNTVTLFQNGFRSARGSFYITEAFTVGSGPMTVRAGDINQDGRFDIVVPNLFDNTITVLRNNGGFSFSPYQLLDLNGTRPIDILLEDFNNDNLMDLAVALFGDDFLEVFLNTGVRLESSGISYPLDQSGIVALASVDMDKDGDKDIMAACWGGESVVLLENSSGAFSVSQTIALEISPSAITAANLFNTNDGDMDILCIGQNSDSLAIIENNGGTLQPPTYLSNSDLPINAVCGNYFGSSQSTLNVAVSNMTDGEVHVFNNNGYQVNPLNFNRVDANPAPMGLGQADFDLDGDVDLIVTNVQDNQITWLENLYRPEGCCPISIVDFGDVCLGESSSQLFQFVNTTSVIVNILNISPSVYDAFSVVPLSYPISVFPNDTILIEISFHPTDMRSYQDGLIIETDYVPAPIAIVPLLGRGIGVVLSSDPQELSFGIVPPNVTAQGTITLINDGNVNAEVYATFTDFHFILDMNYNPIPITVPAYGQTDILVNFTPTANQTYAAQLELTYAPCPDQALIVPLQGTGSDRPPDFTSGSEITVYEDEPNRYYTAHAEDPDGEPVTYQFLDPLPSYTQRHLSDPARLNIEPNEGDRDAQFTVVASDGYLETEWEVTIHVIPVNDPPVLVKLNRYTHAPEDVSVTEMITAGDMLEFTLWAYDPEDSLIQFEIINYNLPTRPDLGPPVDRNKRVFQWQSDFGDEGSYWAILMASDHDASGSISVLDTAYIEVNRALPDLTIDFLGSKDGNNQVFKGQQKTYEVTVTNASAPVFESFQLFLSGMNTIQPADPIVIPSLGIGESVTHSFTITFNRTGHIQLCAQVDYGYEIEELDETNNEICLTVNVNEGVLQVYPNPFTPNEDGFNDRAGFDISELNIGYPSVKIFSFSGFLVRTIDVVSQNILEWDGRDSSGNEMPPGVYLFVLYNRDNKEASGSIVLAR